MSKSISLSDEAYELLLMHKGECSFSEVIMRFFPEKKDAEKKTSVKVEEW